ALGVELEAGSPPAGEPLPGEDDVRGVLVDRVGAGLEDGEVVGVLAPREARVGRRVGVEGPERAVRGVVELDAVAGAGVRVDREGEERALVLPGVTGDVPEVGAHAGLVGPDAEVGALALLPLDRSVTEW